MDRDIELPEEKLETVDLPTSPETQLMAVTPDRQCVRSPIYPWERGAEETSD
jgi:hypothetical protein